MEIIFTNNAKDRSVYRYKKDFERILERACKVLDRKGDWSLSVIYVTPEQTKLIVTIVMLIVLQMSLALRFKMI